MLHKYHGRWWRKGASPLNTSMDGKMGSKLSSPLTSNQLVGAPGAITCAVAGLAPVRG